MTIAAEHLALHPFDGRNLYVELWETTPERAPKLIWKTTENMPGMNHPAGKSVQPYASQLSPPLVPTQQEILFQQMASMRLAGEPPSPAYQVAYQNLSLPPSGMQAPPSLTSGSSASSYMRGTPSHAPAVLATRAAPSLATRGPRYATGSSGIPTNVDRGAVRTEYRGVFISNLSYDVQDSDIQKLFSTHGRIVKIDHKREIKTNSRGKTVLRSRGNAVITFATSEEARRAIEKLDGSTWDGRTLAVRFDIEATPIDPPGRRSKKGTMDGGPLIVDGSTCS